MECKAPNHGHIQTAETCTKSCRICFDGGMNGTESLITPCECTGTMRYVHPSCLKEWLLASMEKSADHKIRTTCEICHQDYTFAYDLQHSLDDAKVQIAASTKFLQVVYGLLLVLYYALGVGYISLTVKFMNSIYISFLVLPSYLVLLIIGLPCISEWVLHQIKNRKANVARRHLDTRISQLKSA